MLSRGILSSLLRRLSPFSQATFLHTSSVLHQDVGPVTEEDISRPIESALPKRKTSRTVFDAKTIPLLKRAKVPADVIKKELERRWKALSPGEKERFKEAADKYNRRLERIKDEVQLTRMGPEPLRPATIFKREEAAKLVAANPSMTHSQALKEAAKMYKLKPTAERKMLNEEFRQQLKEWRERVIMPREPPNPQQKYESDIENKLVAKDPTMLRKEARAEARRSWLEVSDEEKERLKREYDVAYAKWQEAVENLGTSRMIKKKQEVEVVDVFQEVEVVQ